MSIYYYKTYMKHWLEISVDNLEITNNKIIF